ncbi:unnamed protein product [Amoebophrya sp. A25]|nr:unnamed protein product [Amoebophrya sp. A25]|eukprot:GSA25T00017958001.1
MSRVARVVKRCFVIFFVRIKEYNYHTRKSSVVSSC